MSITHHLYGAEASKRRVKLPGTAPRPVCACCGKPYGKRNTQKTSAFALSGESEPQYTGNHLLIQTWVERGATRRKSDAPPEQPGMPSYYRIKSDEYETGTRVTWETWDGQSYYMTQCAPFCGGTCAIAFAKAAYADGARYTLKKPK